MADSWYPASNYETPVIVVTSGDGVESRDGIVMILHSPIMNVTGLGLIPDL